MDLYFEKNQKIEGVINGGFQAFFSSEKYGILVSILDLEGEKYNPLFARGQAIV
jgi:hypothetical protein